MLWVSDNVASIVMPLANIKTHVWTRMLADYIGPLNTSVLYSTIAAISALAIWMVAYTYASLTIFAVIFCFFGSSYFSLCTYPLLDYI